MPPKSTAQALAGSVAQAPAPAGSISHAPASQVILWDNMPEALRDEVVEVDC